jgi:hypothetical protein
MYYFQLGASLLFVIGFVISLIYQFSLSVQVSTKRLDSRSAMRKLFITSFCTWMSMFILVLIWQEKTTWSIGKGVMVFILFSFVAFVLAGISALGLWRWKR